MSSSPEKHRKSDSGNRHSIRVPRRSQHPRIRPESGPTPRQVALVDGVAPSFAPAGRRRFETVFQSARSADRAPHPFPAVRRTYRRIADGRDSLDRTIGTQLISMNLLRPETWVIVALESAGRPRALGQPRLPASHVPVRHFQLPERATIPTPLLRVFLAQ